MFAEILHMGDVVLEGVGTDTPASTAKALADFAVPAKAGNVAKVSAKALAANSREAKAAWP